MCHGEKKGLKPPHLHRAKWVSATARTCYCGCRIGTVGIFRDKMISSPSGLQVFRVAERRVLFLKTVRVAFKGALKGRGGLV